MKRYLPLVTIGVLLIAFRASANLQEIAAGVAIFLFGMLMLEDGFKLFGGGALERVLSAATRTLPRSLLFGIVSTTLMQSSSLVSVITISFLSAGLITLIGGVGIVFGANIGTTTGAWLVAGLGLKVDIAAYAMPMLGISIVLALQSSKPLRGIGLALGGLGFLFLGIHFMKEGFDAFKDQIDLSRYALTGVVGLIVYTLVGAMVTVVMQSSHATLVLTITALAAGQITYENALALAIGANIGTTVTAVLGALSANYQGKRLALAHLIFNALTAGVALVLIVPMRESVDWISAGLGIGDTDYALKLAVFHTLFNLLGLILMLPMLNWLIRFLRLRIVEPVGDRSEPIYLSEAVDAFPQTIEEALRKEVVHLYENSVELILHGLNLHTHEVFASKDIAETVHRSRTAIEFDMDERYEHRVKSLHSAIVEFTTRTGAADLDPRMTERVYALRDVAGEIVRAVKSAKHLRKNISVYTTADHGTATELYDGLRTEIARIAIEIRRLDQTDPVERSTLWLDHEVAQIEEDSKNTTRLIESLIRKGWISAETATSFLNDSDYAYSVMRALIDAARSFYTKPDSAVAEVENILALDDDEIGEAVAGTSDTGTEEVSQK